MSTAAFSPHQASPGPLPSPASQAPRGRRKPRRRNVFRESPSGGASCPPHVLVDDLNIGCDPANLRRCPGCGGMVYLWPCLACRGRKAA